MLTYGSALFDLALADDDSKFPPTQLDGQFLWRTQRGLLSDIIIAMWIVNPRPWGAAESGTPVRNPDLQECDAVS